MAGLVSLLLHKNLDNTTFRCFWQLYIVCNECLTVSFLGISRENLIVNKYIILQVGRVYCYLLFCCVFLFSPPLLSPRLQPRMSSMTGTKAPAHRVGPDYRPDAQKPTATVSTNILYDNVHILPQTSQLLALLTYATPSLV